MKAVAYKSCLPISDTKSLLDIELPQPNPTGRELLIKVNAIAVNPVDYKIRQNAAPENGDYRVLGWDAVGEVIATGDDVSLFKPGDKVFYAGDLNKQGSNAEFQLVDERIVGFKPQSLTDTDAAALPLTSITAYELLFEHLGIEQQSVGAVTKTDEVILVVGAAGGVGSILVQLAKAITGATIIATASRPSSKKWLEGLGADYVVDHSKPLKPQIEGLGFEHVTHVASLNSSESYFETYIDVLEPFGKIGLIDDPKSLDVIKIKPKSLSLHWEFMFARSMFNAADMAQQGVLLNHIASLIDEGHIKTTAGKYLGKINATNLKQAHKELEAGSAIGKIVLSGF
ncbi:MAG: zinc-binding alcohol dehydrogenase family protein [Paraglaciecola sp.]|nr:zinc-binding alcohol dehydrogenase family protein [Paraglaciecola sp.]